MSIIVYICIILFGFLIINHIFEHGMKINEGMTAQTVHSLAGKVGTNSSEIQNVKTALNDTLERSKKLLSKLTSANTTKSMNKAAGKHSSIQSLSLKPKSVQCENFQTLAALSKLQNTSNTNTTNLGSLNGIISNIQSNINKMKKKL